MLGCPIRISWDQRLFAPTPSLSQLITSFIASQSLGIHRSLLFTFFIFILLVFKTTQALSLQHAINTLSYRIAFFLLLFSLFPICQRSSLIYNLFMYDLLFATSQWFANLNKMLLKTLIYSVSILLNLFFIFLIFKKKQRACCFYLLFFQFTVFSFTIYDLKIVNSKWLNCKFL